MEKNKIALVTYSLSSGGLQRVVANSSFMFEELGYQVHLFVLDTQIDYPFAGTIHQFKLDQKGFLGKIKTYYKIKKSIKNIDCTLIIDHRYRLNWMTEVIWQKIIYNHEHVVNYIHSSNILNYLFKSACLNKFLFKNRPMICVSNGVRNILHKDFYYLQAQTIYNFVALNSSKSTDRLQNKYILSIARMDQENVKQVDVLLQCYAKSILPANNINLVILGDGVRLQEMKNLAKSLNISHLVLFKGFEKDPSSYLEHAYFTILTSKYEGLPTVLVESLLMKTPVISFDCKTGPNEIIIDRVNGLLIEDQNQNKLIEGMNELVSNEQLYLELKKNAYASTKKFSLESIKKEWVKLINGTH